VVDEKKDMKDKEENTPEEEAEQSPETDGTPEADGTLEGDENSEPGEDAAPEDATPEDATPEDGAPEGSAPEDSAPEDSAPEDSTPEDSTPDEPVSEEAAAEDAPSDEPATREEAPVAAASGSTSEDHVEYDSTGEPISEHHVEGIAAFFDHPKHLLAAATYARDSHYEDFEAFSPFPIHGMDEAMGLGRSWIPWVTMGAAMVGFICANLLQFGMMTFDWPMIVGGKPFAPWPSFVPIMFELSVLIGGVTTAVVMLKAAGCFKKPLIIDPSITDDRFVLWISAKDNKFEMNEAIDFLETLNPLEVRKVVKDV
jgi:hypothetical protein